MSECLYLLSSHFTNPCQEEFCYSLALSTVLVRHNFDLEAFAECIGLMGTMAAVRPLFFRSWSGYGLLRVVTFTRDRFTDILQRLTQAHIIVFIPTVIIRLNTSTA